MTVWSLNLWADSGMCPWCQDATPSTGPHSVLVFLPLGGLSRWVSMSGNATHLKLCCSFGHYIYNKRSWLALAIQTQPLAVKRKWWSYHHQKHYPDRAWYFEDRRDESGRDRERGCAESARFLMNKARKGLKCTKVAINDITEKEKRTKILKLPGVTLSV